MKNALLNFSIALAISVLSTACAKGSSSGDSTSAPAATTATPATTCSAGNLYSSQYGCQPQCGQNSIWYNNQCQNVGNGTGDLCQSICPPGYVLAGRGTACLPKGNCGPCQGSYNGQCYQGDGAGY